jgi:transposase
MVGIDSLYVFMNIEKGYRVRLYSSRSQERKLNQICGSVRFVWNHYLSKRRRNYLDNGEIMNYYDCAKDLTGLKRQADYSWLNEANATSLQGGGAPWRAADSSAYSRPVCNRPM